MGYGLTLLTPPSAEPVTLAEAKSWLRVDMLADDTLIASLVSAARQLVEKSINRQLVSATWRMSLDRFPPPVGWGGVFPPYSADYGAIRLPMGPLASVSQVTYYDLAGTLQTLDPATYDVDTGSDPGRLSLAQYRVWPITRNRPGCVMIDFVAGYGGPSAVPPDIKCAILLTLAHWYENREAVVTGVLATTLPLAVESLLMANWNGNL